METEKKYMKFCTTQIKYFALQGGGGRGGGANNKGTDKTEWVRRLVFTFAVCQQQNRFFSGENEILEDIKIYERIFISS